MKLFRPLIPIIALLFVGVYVRNYFLAPLFPLQQSAYPEDIQETTYDNLNQTGEYHGKKAYSYQIPDPPQSEQVLGEESGEKRIEVDLTNQRVYAFQGDTKVYDFVISSGLHDWTPRGEFRIWIKLRYTRMRGGSQALGTYYDLPNVPYTMFFSNSQISPSRGFSLHGTYWHDNFGQPMSHGCVNMKNADVEKLYFWAMPDLGGKSSIRATPENPGTKVIIYGKYQYK